MKKLIFGLLMMTPMLYAEGDFCEEDKPCDEKPKAEKKVPPKTAQHYVQIEDMDEADNTVTWPGKLEDSFNDALTR